MTSEEYKAERKLRKLSQAALMKLVGVTQATISSRETGRRDIKKEAEIAIKSLPIPKQNAEVSHRDRERQLDANHPKTQLQGESLLGSPSY